MASLAALGTHYSFLFVVEYFVVLKINITTITTITTTLGTPVIHGASAVGSAFYRGNSLDYTTMLG